MWMWPVRQLVQGKCLHITHSILQHYIVCSKTRATPSAQASSAATAPSPASTTAWYTEIANLILAAAKRLLDA